MHPRSLPLALALLLKFSITAGTEVSAGSVQVLTFIEVRVEARGHASGVLRQQSNASSENRPSHGQITPLQEISRPERFAVLERETPVRALPKDLTDDLTAPPDQRLNRVFDEADAAADAQFDAHARFYVVTHVDVTTPDRSRVETALHKLADAVRQSDGNLGFEVLQQIDRPNHYNLISAWLGESPFHTFASSPAAREFRQTIAPLLGSPYDERLYRRIN